MEVANLRLVRGLSEEQIGLARSLVFEVDGELPSLNQLIVAGRLTLETYVQVQLDDLLRYFLCFS